MDRDEFNKLIALNNGLLNAQRIAPDVHKTNSDTLFQAFYEGKPSTTLVLQGFPRSSPMPARQTGQVQRASLTRSMSLGSQMPPRGVTNGQTPTGAQNSVSQHLNLSMASPRPFQPATSVVASPRTLASLANIQNPNPNPLTPPTSPGGFPAPVLLGAPVTTPTTPPRVTPPGQVSPARANLLRSTSIRNGSPLPVPGGVQPVPPFILPLNPLSPLNNPTPEADISTCWSNSFYTAINIPASLFRTICCCCQKTS